MNPNLAQLAYRAGITVNAESEKFAELIVQEMLRTCAEHPAWYGRMIAEEIKQHFGINK